MRSSRFLGRYFFINYLRTTHQGSLTAMLLKNTGMTRKYNKKREKEAGNLTQYTTGYNLRKLDLSLSPAHK